jgi:acetyl-CoA carboxylase biotin carboxyl carrier protein
MARFDVDEDLVRKLSSLLNETGLTEIEYSKGEEHIRVSRSIGLSSAAVLASEVPIAAAAAGAPADDKAAAALQGLVIAAPMVGTVYLSPEPGAAAFVRVGDAVEAGQTLLLIEAMKTYNDVRAPRAGKVLRVLVSDATPVEYGEALLVLD